MDMPAVERIGWRLVFTRPDGTVFEKEGNWSDENKMMAVLGKTCVTDDVAFVNIEGRLHLKEMEVDHE